MPFVEIYKLKNDGSQEIIATCKINRNAVECAGRFIFIENLKNGGIRDYSSPEGNKLFFKDGLLFLEQLKYNFKSGYINASEVKP
ncbi:MAG: hypothetical protein A3G49_04775 [Candidatus Sungbacteria bacterium RIFCSPLOWO2_12_FULL_41_11]|uniref:Uncharacterized protein n=1 Tax=Candidatus Sungbacteria bacterium RIFCSPLOWO2_12_FULL_41_11 TaxID=1802286 RepID=A0A1G2LQA9_9BACT|nr:MAG: hypothetical protein UV01_C0004G0011 [Parcubacteria group bacterium GW2011_GWA2_42_14]OGZ99624.1 MAG: hypothetical protein A3D41_05745 [Candidatus Sungbacteria bacterium RIFCSPHIGHO2_02_FULL_41_12b]OHA13022.1 MAG: hypothetical protein A3G49_04775 [Candidatus Sungbacteria bacterium RIFCSPLOWO2_12_FULL_41_11]